MPTYTLYASTADGYVRSANTTYATARAGSGLTVDTTSTSNSWGVGQRLNAGTYQLTESFFSFDTSSVLGTVTSVTLSLFLETDSSTTDFTVEARLYDWGTGLTTADWVPGANLAALPLLGSVSTAGLAPPAYFAFAENGTTFRTSINQAGETRIVVVSSRLTTGTAPTGVEAIEVSYADTTGTAQDPKLVIVTTTTPSAASTAGMSLQAALNAVAGTTGLEAQEAANRWAGLTGNSRLELVGALNVKAGNARANWKELAGVLEQLGFTQEGL